VAPHPSRLRFKLRLAPARHLEYLKLRLAQTDHYQREIDKLIAPAARIAGTIVPDDRINHARWNLVYHQAIDELAFAKGLRTSLRVLSTYPASPIELKARKAAQAWLKSCAP
jgi:hypothetical protein